MYAATTRLASSIAKLKQRKKSIPEALADLGKLEGHPPSMLLLAGAVPLCPSFEDEEGPPRVIVAVRADDWTGAPVNVRSSMRSSFVLPTVINHCHRQLM